MEADAALVGAAGAVVLDAVARVDVDLAVGLLDRNLDGDLAVRGPEDDAEVVGELQAVGREVEVMADDLEIGHLGALPRLARRSEPSPRRLHPRRPAGTCPGAHAPRRAGRRTRLGHRAPPLRLVDPSSHNGRASRRDLRPVAVAGRCRRSALEFAFRGHSSVGRASGLHPGGRGFESRWLHLDLWRSVSTGNRSSPPSAGRPASEQVASGWTRVHRSSRGTSDRKEEYCMGKDVARLSRTRGTRPLSLALGGALLLAGLTVAPAAFAAPGADCQPFSSTACLLPFPNNLYTVKDNSTPDRRPRPPAGSRDAEEQRQRGDQLLPSTTETTASAPAATSSSGCPGSTTRPR